jgi:hypothetical protein
LIKVKLSMPLAQMKLVTPQMMRVVALDSIALIRERTVSGLDVNGQPFKPYSTKPIYIQNTRFPRPRGGQPAGKSVFYQGGYKEYKELSREPGKVGPRRNKKAKGPTAEVDLTLTGLMLNSIQVTKVLSTGYILEVIGKAGKYAGYVNVKREFMGLTIPEQRMIAESFDEQIAKKLRGR